MKTITIRVPTRVHTRKLDRNVARERMKKAGIKRINKDGYFAENWRTTTANRPLEK